MKAWLIGLALARSLDAWSSCQAFDAGKVEANPLLPHSCVGAVSAQAGISLGQIVLLQKLSKTHPTAAKWIAGATISVELGVTAQNRRR